MIGVIDGAGNVQVTDPDYLDAIRTVNAEGRPDPQEMGAIAGVIKNRSDHTGKGFGATVREPSQFEPWSNPRSRRRMLGVEQNSREFQEAFRAGFPVLAGKIPDPSGGATMFYAPEAQRAVGRRPPVFEDGSGVDIGRTRFFKGDYRRTHPAGPPPVPFPTYSFETPRPKGLFDQALFDLRRGYPHPIPVQGRTK